MKTRVSLLIAALGFWLLSVTLTFGDSNLCMTLSDGASALLLISFGLLSMSPNRMWTGWAAAFVGFWLQLSPLVFWEKSPLVYINDTFVGVLAIILAFCLKKNDEEVQGASCPQGWSYNPSGWGHRIPTVALAMLCWFFARYMAAFQLGYIDHIWDPFFHEGTLHVITSKISKDFPVSDAGMGALCYTMEAILGWQGGKGRWATMPWLVLAFGFLVIPVGVVSITLIILQPVAVGAWCSWCLATAVSMLLMILLTAGELAACVQLLYETKKKGGSLWQVLWKGASPKKGIASVEGKGMGISCPWTLIASIAAGLWLMAAPASLHISGGVAISNYILGPLVAAISTIALAEVFRSVRYLNVLFGLGLLLAPWLMSGVEQAAMINNLVFGVVVILLAIQRGKIRQKYGSWNSLIF